MLQKMHMAGDYSDYSNCKMTTSNLEQWDTNSYCKDKTKNLQSTRQTETTNNLKQA